MRALTRALRWPLSLAVALVLLSSQGLAAQEMAQEEGEQAYWHVSLFQIPWERVDSLQTLIERTQPATERAIEAGRLLDYKILIHHMGDEYNVVEMRKYPSWAAIEEGAGISDFGPEVLGEETRQAIDEGFNWVYEGHAAHKDLIYIEATDG